MRSRRYGGCHLDWQLSQASGSTARECFCHWLLTNPEPMDTGGPWGVRGGMGQCSGSQPFWGPPMLGCWLAAPCPEQQRLLEDGEHCSQRYQRCNHLGLQVLVGLTITHI